MSSVRISSSFSLVFLCLSMIASTEKALASACCAGATQMPTIMTTDSKGQVSVGVRNQWTVGDVGIDGQAVRRADKDRDEIWGLGLTGVYAFSDRYQMAAQIPFSSRRVDFESETQSRLKLGGGDLSVMGSFEFLPELTYTPWVPRGFIFAKFITPTGTSIYDSDQALLSALGGQGFYAAASGAAFFKVKGHWDFSSHVEGKYLWPRQFASGGVRTQITPDPQFGGSVGAGFSPPGSMWRGGVNMGFIFTGEMKFEGSLPNSKQRRVWDINFSLSRLLPEDWTLGLYYRDQTFWGPASNTTLAREISFLVQKRYPL